ncbi:MAG: GNAT family N-acetyltransferase [Litorimonas sp.]
MSEPLFQARILTSISDVSQADWDALIPDGNHPFLTWRFLHACEQSGAATPETGWHPRHIWLEDQDGTAIGAAPLYAKTHSQGEYVFDHGWADALERAGGSYYPKLQCSVPFTPATGPRLLAKNDEHKHALALTMIQACNDWNMSGAHLTFLQDGDKNILKEVGFAAREDRQFHFMNRGYDNFDHFLDSLASRKRKNIRKERANAQDGVIIKRLTGDDIKSEHWDVFYQCYLDTGQRKWGRPYLTRQFFAMMQDTMRDDIILIMAWMDGTPIAAALNFIGSDALYGRNWGCLTHKPFLHFELCYYQAIDAALELGLPRAEAGAQGEHKLARGYEPVTTHSAHYLAHTGLRAAIEDYLVHERHAVKNDINILTKHTPFKAESS